MLAVALRGVLGAVSVEALVDTCFNGHLIVTPDIVSRLGLRYYGPVAGMQADGQVRVRRGYLVEVDWLAGPVRCVAVESNLPWCVVGTALLDGRRLEIDFGTAKTVEVR
jgi:predicted aspartyl protease